MNYANLSVKYKKKTKEVPKGFLQFTKSHGVDNPNTCATRLSFALFEVNKAFFKDVKALSGTEWYGLPTVASDLAIVLNKKIRKAWRINKKKDISGKKGIIFFDTVPPYDVSGHISLWDGEKVVDNGDYFSKSPRVYFWEL